MKKLLLLSALFIFACSENEDLITSDDTISNFLYSIKSDYENEGTTKLIVIDTNTGNETTIIDYLTTDNCESSSVHINSSEIFFVSSIGDGNSETKIYAADISNNTFSVTNFNSNSEIDYELAPLNNGTLYAIKQSYISNNFTSKLVSINPTSGSEVVIIDLNTTDNFNSIAIDIQANIVYGVTSIGDGNTESELYTVDIANSSFAFQTLSNVFNYELALSDDGVLYAMENDFNGNDSSKLYSLNPTNGNKLLLVDLQTTDDFTNLGIKDNNLFGITNLGDGNPDSEIYYINIQNNTFSFSFINDISGVNYELINK